MKAYLFYRVADSLGRYDVPRLFAITDNKELANEFKETRNMHQIICKVEEMKRSEYKKFANDCKGHVLRECGFITKAENVTKNSKIVSFVATFHEEEYVYMYTDKVWQDIGKFTVPEARMLKPEFLKALKNLQYFEIYKFSHAEENSYFYSGIENDFDPAFYRLEIDTLSIFIRQFGDTLKL